jgi:hypothetical protein
MKTKTKSEKRYEIINPLRTATKSINNVARYKLRETFGGCFNPPMLLVSRSWKLLYPLLDGKTNKCRITKAIAVVCQLMVLAWLTANKKTGIKKNEKGNRKCFTVLLSNHERMSMFFIFFLMLNK